MTVPLRTGYAINLKRQHAAKLADELIGVEKETYIQLKTHGSLHCCNIIIYYFCSEKNHNHYGV